MGAGLWADAADEAREDTAGADLDDELRGWLCALAEMTYQNNGYRRMKNPRIWSMHDLHDLVSGVR